MNSSVKVDFAGKGNALQPVIRIKVSSDGDDVRDGLLVALFEQLGSQSSWLSATFDHHIINGSKDSTTYVTLYPVTPSELSETIEYISARLSGIGNNLSPFIQCSDSLGCKEKEQVQVKRQWEVISITREGNEDKDGTPMHYKLVVNKSLKGMREGVLKEAIEDVINNPANFAKYAV